MFNSCHPRKGDAMRGALLIVALIFWGSAWSQPIKDNPATKAGSRSQPIKDKGIPSPEFNPIGTKTNPAVVKVEHPENDEATRIAREDLKAQNRQADWAFWLVIIGVFTGGALTYQLVLLRGQVKTAEFQTNALMSGERAYIICGGLYGREKPRLLAKIFSHNPPKGREKASSYQGPWRLQISNYGRSMGVITKIEWGICPEAEFDRVKHLLVSEILNRQELQRWMKKPCEIKEPFPAMEGTSGIPYRHVECERDVGTVFFGRITYTDIFRKEHYSTFSLLHKVEHSDSIGRSYAEDWN